MEWMFVPYFNALTQTIFTSMMNIYDVLPDRFKPKIGDTKCWFEGNWSCKIYVSVGICVAGSLFDIFFMEIAQVRAGQKSDRNFRSFNNLVNFHPQAVGQDSYYCRWCLWSFFILHFFYACQTEQSSPGHLIFFLLPIGIQISINFTLFVLTAIHCNRIKAEIRRMQRCDSGEQQKRRIFVADKAMWVTSFLYNILIFFLLGVL